MSRLRREQHVADRIRIGRALKRGDSDLLQRGRGIGVVGNETVVSAELSRAEVRAVCHGPGREHPAVDVRLKDRIVALERVAAAIRARLRPIVLEGHELTVAIVIDGEAADRLGQRPLIEHALDDPRLFARPGQRRKEQCPEERNDRHHDDEFEQ